jgi:hypothetical protein
MKVYVERDGAQRWVGRADVPDMADGHFEVPLFGASATIVERFAVGSLAHHRPDGQVTVERAVLATAEQMVELLPGWQPLQA